MFVEGFLQRGIGEFDAANIGDVKLTATLIEEIRPHNQPLAEELLKMAKGYRFD